MTVTFRRAEPSDATFLAEMLAAAAFWRVDEPRLNVADVLGQPEMAHYVLGWPQPGDVGVIAVAEQQPVGAAWVRLLPESDPGYGFVDAETPELSMAVRPGWRGRGVGTHLLHALTAALRADGVASLSLSVEADNDARRLYDRAGFRRVGEVDGSLTMLLRLPPDTR